MRKSIVAVAAAAGAAVALAGLAPAALSADGATLVVGKGDGAFFRKTLSAPAFLNRFTIQGKVEPRVVEVDGKWSVNDGGRTIEAYSLDNPHAQGYLIPYVPDAKLGFVTDLWNPGAPVAMANPNMVALVNGVPMTDSRIVAERFGKTHAHVLRDIESLECSPAFRQSNSAS